jgi:hypothetical protein
VITLVAAAGEMRSLSAISEWVMPYDLGMGGSLAHYAR